MFQQTDYLFQKAFKCVAWIFVALCAFNALYFILRTTNPVIETDAWFYLDVFSRKAINGTLGISDFFVKRSPDDHAAPLFRILSLINLRYFGLDFVFDAVVGLLAAVASAFVYYKIIILEPSATHIRLRYLCWVSVCCLLFSLNSDGMWTWSLVALENVTTFIILLFILATWHALRSQRHTLLAVTAIFLGISSDDSALIAALAVVGAICLALISDSALRCRATGKTIGLIVFCLLLARAWYAYMPMVTTVHKPLSTILPVLYEQFKGGGWWLWITLPLALPVYFQNPLVGTTSDIWPFIQLILAALLFTAHILFWRRALRAKCTLPCFVAVSIMLVTYGWLAGIILWRVSAFLIPHITHPTLRGDSSGAASWPQRQ